MQWVSEAKYIENRNRSPSLKKEQHAEIATAYDYMWEHAKDEFHKQRGKGPGDTDTLILATALVLDIAVVTDDQDMIEMAESFEVKQMSSLELMKLMVTENHINMNKVSQVVQQWQFEDETPNKNWRKQYREVFGASPPKYP
ncbi:MAG: type II toxin-antitoxin system VapC family toxin [Akkermansiaceae bacterium]